VTTTAPSGFYDCSDPDQRGAGVEQAVHTVRSGGLVVMPTDTVYGLGGDAFTPPAVRRLRHVLGGAASVPVPVLIGSRGTLDGLVSSVPPTVRALVEAFWPGPLTLLLEHAPSLAWDLGDARGTVAVRMPLHPVALEVLERTGPMAVTTARRPGWPVPRDAAEVRGQLGAAVGVYLEAGPAGDAPPGREPAPAGVSTVVDLTSAVPRLVRPGVIGYERLAEVVPDLHV
jgi:tRNA threonylcarbamoyl adenosine modification protein (Sua5/YciO/YrdC/YwlC family)